jgi:hypothetical protein
VSDPLPAGVPPVFVTTVLRLEALAALVAAVIAYQAIGGNWWLFAILFLVPDLSILASIRSGETGARIYNLAHTYVGAALLALIGWVAGIPLLLQIALIWAAHIGMDRALGYGLKYGSFGITHLGLIGKNKAAAVADAS